MNTPQALLAHTGKTFPELWREVDAARARKGDDLPDWADHVFLPLAAWYAITCNLFDVEVLSDDMVTTMGILACIGAWRPTQDIVRFDPDVYVSLSKTGIDGNLPVDVLKRLPAWCLYIETPGLIYDERVWEGFFVFLESDANTGHDELRIIFSSQECAYYPCILHIGPWTLQHACKLSNDFSTTLLYERGKKIDGKHPICVDLGLQTALNCILYVCSYGLNDQEGWGSSGSIAYPRDAAAGIRHVISWGGRPVRSICRAWHTALTRAGIGRRIRPYDLRHAFATYALAGSADIGSVARLMGHTDASMILKTYQHVQDAQKRAAVEAAPDILDLAKRQRLPGV